MESDSRLAVAELNADKFEIKNNFLQKSKPPNDQIVKISAMTCN